MKRRTYKAELKQMNANQLEKYINRNTDLMLDVGHGPGSTSLLTKIVWAEHLLKKLTVENQS